MTDIRQHHRFKRHAKLETVGMFVLVSFGTDFTHTHTHTHTFNGFSSGTTRVSWHQKGKTNLDFTEARDSEWQWHQHPTTQFSAGQMPFLPPNQQCQSTEGIWY